MSQRGTAEMRSQFGRKTEQDSVSVLLLPKNTPTGRIGMRFRCWKVRLARNGGLKLPSTPARFSRPTLRSVTCSLVKSMRVLFGSDRQRALPSRPFEHVPNVRLSLG